MALSVTNMKSKLTGGGDRPSKFRASFTNPISDGGAEKIEFLLKATSTPPSTLGVIEVPYMGRKIKLPGDRTFDEWEVTILNDEDHSIKDALEAWSNAINGHASNSTSLTPELLKSEGYVEQLAQDGRVLRRYLFKGVFPSLVAGIPLDWDTVDTIEEFTTTLQYDYWVIDTSVGETGDAGGFPDSE